MKYLKNKFIIFGVVCFLTTFITQAQDDISSTNFSYRSFSISPFGVFVGKESGVAFNGDVSFDYGKNIFSLSAGTGTEGNFIGSNNEFREINLLYGRSFPLSEKIFTDLYVGAGYFSYSTYGTLDSYGKKGDIRENTIGFPIGAKFQYMLGPRFSMGLKVGANINSLETIGTLGLLLQWNALRN